MARGILLLMPGTASRAERSLKREHASPFSRGKHRYTLAISIDAAQPVFKLSKSRLQALQTVYHGNRHSYNQESSLG